MEAKNDCREGFDEIELTEEELNKLPARYRAWGKEIGGKFQNHFISICPPYLKFPYDDPRYHEGKLTVWNKTNRLLELIVEIPQCGVFQVFYNKGILFGGTASTMIVRCIPGDIQLCTDFIRISIVNQKVEPLIIPLELFPSISWFALPRIVVVPSIPVGKQIETRINLPKPHAEGRFYFIIKVLTEMESFSVTPTKGFLRSGTNVDGVHKIVVKYTPVEYTTLVYTFQIVFPEMLSFQPYEVNVYTRCIPNSESVAIRMATEEIEKLILKPLRDKTPVLRLKFPPPKQKEEKDNTVSTLDDDLFTPAGIRRFLSKKGGKVFENKKTLGPLGLTTQQEQKTYKSKEKEFHDHLNRIEIHQKNLVLQHNKTFLGEDSILDDTEELQRIREEQKQFFMEYQNSMGLTDNDLSDLTRNTLISSHQRSVRDAKQDFTKNIPHIDNEMVTQQTKLSSRWAKKIAQRRFVQAILVIITRRRASRRIVKLRNLVKDIKGQK